MPILINILLVIFVLDALFMVLFILMQRPKSEGLGAAFGGGVTENLFGAQTTNVLTKITSWLAGIFFFITFLLSVLYAHQTVQSSRLREELTKTEVGKVPTVPQPGPAATAPVGAPGTVTNPAPGPAGDAVGKDAPVTAADQAVGVSAPVAVPAAPVAPTVAPAGTPAPTATAKPSP
ncbi:MAG: preprotein translocase subunit SecG [Chthoniobacterales bacterium]